MGLFEVACDEEEGMIFVSIPFVVEIKAVLPKGAYILLLRAYLPKQQFPSENFCVLLLVPPLLCTLDFLFLLETLAGNCWMRAIFLFSLLH